MNAVLTLGRELATKSPHPYGRIAGVVLMGIGGIGVLMSGESVEQADQAADQATTSSLTCANCAENPCAHLACGAPGSNYRGGAHGCMATPTGDGRDSHHMPARSISPLHPAVGPASQMDPRDHRLTNSYGRTPATNATLASQQQMIASGNFVSAQAIDVAEVLTKFPGKYDAAIAQMEAYTACLKRNGLA